MTTVDRDVERGEWLATCNEFEVNLLLGWLLGSAPEVFDSARTFIERIRAACAP